MCSRVRKRMAVQFAVYLTPLLSEELCFWSFPLSLSWEVVCPSSIPACLLVLFPINNSSSSRDLHLCLRPSHIPSSMDGQLCFLQKDYYWFIFLPNMFILLVLIFFFLPICHLLKPRQRWTRAASPQPGCLPALKIQRTRSCNVCLSVALAVLSRSELPLARGVFKFFIFCVDSLFAFLNLKFLNSYGYKDY